VLRRLVIFLAIAAVALAGWWVLSSWGRTPTPWGSITIDGRDVTVSYTGSECRDGADLSFDESATQVVVTVHETVRAMSCSDVGVSYDLSSRLPSRLNGREIVDGACLEEPWKSRPACGVKSDVTIK
jgi:hypothetical protein